MGVFEKLKNVFFEEEYVEVEEPVKKKTTKEQIAKKIELPEIKKRKKEKDKEPEEAIEITPEIEEEQDIEISDRDILRKNNNGFKFPMNFEEEDFKNDEYKDEIKPEPKKEIKKELKRESKRENLYKEKEEQPYSTINYQGLYEGSLDIKKKKEFKPTPIISPIYGVLDKNYTKDEIVTKREIRISSSPKNVDLDSVREKAYGDLASDITASMYENEAEIDENKDDDNLLYDLNEENSPSIDKVTVGDAEEYYNDLGLEYNIDYKDTSKEKASGRRVKKEESKKIEKEPIDDEGLVEDNLFDLIDSMYEDKE